MKRLLILSILCGALASGVMAEDAKSNKSNKLSGVFVGVELGGGIITQTASYNDTTNGSATIGFDWGIKLGYQHYFTQSQGLRAYVNYGMAHAYPYYSASINTGSSMYETYGYYTSQRITVNADYLFDFIDTGSSRFGVFGGIFLGYHEVATTHSTKNSIRTYNSTQFTGGVGFGFNVGLAATLAKHHKIEFGAKIPVVGPSRGSYYSYGSNTTDDYKYASVNVGYSFVF